MNKNKHHSAFTGFVVEALEFGSLTLSTPFREM